MLLDMGDTSRDGIAEVLRCDSSSLALSLEEPEATLIDCANQTAVPLNLDAAILGCYLVGGAYLNHGIQTAVVKLDVAGTQPDRGPGEWAPVDLLRYLCPSISDARCEPEGQPQQLAPGGLCMPADPYEIGNRIDPTARINLYFAGESILVQDG